MFWLKMSVFMIDVWIYVLLLCKQISFILTVALIRFIFPAVFKPQNRLVENSDLEHRHVPTHNYLISSKKIKCFCLCSFWFKYVISGWFRSFIFGAMGQKFSSFIFLQNHKLNFLNKVFIKEKHFVFSFDDRQIIDLLMLSFSDFINTFELWKRTHIYTLHIFKMYSDSRHSCT